MCIGKVLDLGWEGFILGGLLLGEVYNTPINKMSYKVFTASTLYGKRKIQYARKMYFVQNIQYLLKPYSRCIFQSIKCDIPRIAHIYICIYRCSTTKCVAYNILIHNKICFS